MIGSFRQVPSQQNRDALRHIFVRSRTFAVSVIVGAALLPRAEAAVTIGGPFTLSAPDGRTVTDHDLFGKWLLVYFGYTMCLDSCPTALADVAKALEILGADAKLVQPVFITLDPRRDKPEILGGYAKSFSPHITALTGSQEQIDAVAHAYGAYALPHGADPSLSEGLLDHSVYIYFMDPNGHFIRAFDPSWSTDRIAEVVRQTIKRGYDKKPSDLSVKP